MAQQLTAFEKKRQELIARNKARMAELGLAHVRARSPASCLGFQQAHTSAQRWVTTPG